MKNYFLGKLTDINYSMAIHDGNANRRLGRYAKKVLLLPRDNVPTKYLPEFDKLIQLIEETYRSNPEHGLTPVRIMSIRNSTAARYIKMLLDMEHELLKLENDEKTS